MSDFGDSQGPVRCAVIGAGVVGLSVATQLQDQLSTAGCPATVTVMAESFCENTTSYGAGGFWEPYQVGGTPDELINRWGDFSYRQFLRLHTSPHAAEAGIQLFPAHFLFEESEMPYVIPCWKDAVINFKELTPADLRTLALPEKFVGGFSFLTATADQSYYLKWLTKELKRKGTLFVEAKIESLAALANEGRYDIIVNCTGIGAEKLMLSERDMYPVRGQVLRVKAPWMKAFWNFGPAYLIPNVDTLVVGGTAQTGDYSTELSDSDTKEILDKVCAVFPALKDAPVEKVWAGLRPCRESGVRVQGEYLDSSIPEALAKYVATEIENKELKTPGIIMAHCYGHGGCGVTLGMGCANDLVENHIRPLIPRLRAIARAL